ncbi:MAG TPA: ABC transporter ATP-binding protein [Candidatus Dormibacteraeota bacterium]|jgi:branched-chain amino acid transport system ATP-binding protein|nr:ABC transporter ATP-binding protein [Candidatus Dormibacteraeota bacterium]
MDALLAVEGLWAGYGHSVVLRDVSLTVAPSEVLAVLGANGAGKTTLLRAVGGLIPSRRGRVVLDGAEITAASTVRRARLGIAHVPEGRALHPSMSVHEHMVMGGITLPRREANRRIVELEERFPLLRRRRAGVHELSGGEQQILAIARALVARPRLLLLDEPSTGLAPLIVRQVMTIVSDLRSEGMAVVLVEQNVSIAQTVADRAVVLERGVVAASGGADMLHSSEQLAALYLGGATEQAHATA